MCGIAGIVSYNPSDHEIIGKMTESLIHRGPDSCGFFRDGLISLGHRRLSIIDLSEDAKQPISNEDGSIYLVCNGEIYNFIEKTIELKAKGHIFRSKSDCEVLIHLYEEYGDNFLDYVNGMYAFALWDGRRKRMIAAVDRFGKKPFYYALCNERLFFASELKSLLHSKLIERDIDLHAIDRYLSLRYIPAPLTIFRSIKKLEQSMLMIWQNGKLTFKRYWKPLKKDLKVSDNSYTDSFEALMKDAVYLRLQSDVPLGIYLSGGVDSAAVAGLMSNLFCGKKISYTVSFDYQYDEHSRANRVASYLNYEYNPVTVTPYDFDIIQKIIYHMDEPFGDMLCLPAFLLAKKAKEKLTVVLTGDGADEILSGYLHQKLMILRQRYKSVFNIPGIGSLLSGINKIIPLSLLNYFFDYPDKIRPRERMKLSQALANSSNFGAFYDTVTSCFTQEDKKKLYSNYFMKNLCNETLAEEYQNEIQKGDDFSFYSRLSLLDLKYWIPFSVIYRLDKMNMAHAVETRSPFLDYRVVEYALNLPDEWKLNKNRDKEVLRCLIERLYPPALREMGKQAFYMPMISGYMDRFRSWISELLNIESVKRRGLFEWDYIENLINLSRRESMLANRQLTSLAMLELWFRVFFDRDC